MHILESQGMGMTCNKKGKKNVEKGAKYWKYWAKGSNGSKVPLMK